MRKTLVLLAAALLTSGALIPLATAGWKMRGSNEPDTLQDVADGLMYLDPDTEKDGKKVYFNVFGRVSRFTQYNPNIAATGSSMQPPVQTTFTGFLGIWKDCNADGYVGMSEYGLFEYRAELLTDSSICPATTVDTNNPPVPYPFNDGAWVREFIFIGPSNRDGAKGPSSGNPTVFIADNTRIWGDWNLPGEAPRIVCPTGGNLDTRTTGGMLDWADCIAGYVIMPTLNEVQDDTGLPVGGWNVGHPDQSDNTLNVENPVYKALYGDNMDEHGGLLGRNDHTSGSETPQAYDAWDCNAASPTPSGSTSVNPDGSAWETLNESYNVLNPRAPADKKHQCSPSDTDGLTGSAYPRLAGSGDAQESNRGKVDVDHEFKFSYGSRKTPIVSGGALGPFAPADLGLAVERDDGPVGAAWRTNAGITTGPQLITRGSSIGPANANWMSFYARVGDAVFAAGIQAPSGVSLTYGSEACTSGIGAGAGIQNGWNCDPNEWYADCAAQTPPTQTSECQVVGESYHLRDIDCWDGRIVRGVPVYASTVPLSASGLCTLHPDHEDP